MTDQRGPLDFYQPTDMATLPRSNTTAPVAVPSFWEAAKANFNVALDEQFLPQENRLNRAYEDIADDLVKRGAPRSRFYLLSGSHGIAGKGLQKDRVWEAVENARATDPRAYPGVPATRDLFEEQTAGRNGAHAQDLQTASHGGWGGSLAGGLAGGLADPVNLASMMVGAGEAGLARRIAIDALTNVGVEAVEMPATIYNRARMGEETTARDVVTRLGMAATFGAAFPLAIGGAVKATGAIGRGVQSGAGRLADRMRAEVGVDNMTPAERAATAALDREDENLASNPFEPGAGSADHLDRLAAAEARLLGRAPPREYAPIAPPADRPVGAPSANNPPPQATGRAPPGSGFAQTPFSAVKQRIIGRESASAGTYNAVVYNHGAPKRPTDMTLGEVFDFQVGPLRAATRGRRGPKDIGSTGMGAYQFESLTLKQNAEGVFGASWREQRFTPDVQDRVAAHLFDRVKGDPRALATTWATFAREEGPRAPKLAREPFGEGPTGDVEHAAAQREVEAEDAALARAEAEVDRVSRHDGDDDVPFGEADAPRSANFGRDPFDDLDDVAPPAPRDAPSGEVRPGYGEDDLHAFWADQQAAGKRRTAVWTVRDEDSRIVDWGHSEEDALERQAARAGDERLTVERVAPGALRERAPAAPDRELFHGTRGDWAEENPNGLGMTFYGETRDVAERYAEGGGGRRRSGGDAAVRTHRVASDAPILDVTTSDGARVLADLPDATGRAQDIIAAARKGLRFVGSEGDSALWNLQTNIWQMTKNAAGDMARSLREELVGPLRERGYAGMRFTDDAHPTVALFDEPVARAADRLDQLDNTPTEPITGFDHPEDFAATAQAESLEHDLRQTLRAEANERGARERAYSILDRDRPVRRAVTLDEARKAVRSDVLGRPLTNAETGLVATLSRNSLDKMSSDKAVAKSRSAADHALAIANADALFTRARLLETHADRKGDPNIVSIHRFEAMLTGTDGPLKVKLTVKETRGPNEPNPFYTLEAVQADKEGGPGRRAPSEDGIERAPALAPEAPHTGPESELPETTPPVEPSVEVAPVWSDTRHSPDEVAGVTQSHALDQDLREWLAHDDGAGLTVRLDEDGDVISAADALDDLDADEAAIEAAWACMK